MLYPLFELAAQLRVSSSNDRQAQRRRQSPVVSLVQSKKPLRPPRITHCTQRQSGSYTVTVLVSNNDFIIIRYEENGSPPVTKDLQWFQDPNKAICAITADHSGSWAAVVCSDRSIYIIPVLGLMGAAYSGGAAKGNPRWKTNDLTKIEFTANIGLPSAAVWWHTLDDKHIVVLGTEKGELVVVDLDLGRDVRTVNVGDAILSLDIIRHESSVGYLLAFSKEGSQWGMLLEQCTEVSALTNSMEMDAEILDYEVVSPSSLPIRSILHAGLLTGKATQFSDGDSPGFGPVRFQQFTQNIQLTSQHARGRSLVAGHNHTSNIFKIYDSSIDNWMPLYVYRIPPATQQALLTDRLLFCISISEDKQVTLTILSNQKSEVSSPDQLANKDAVMQTFSFPPGETFIGLYPHRALSSPSPSHHSTGGGGTRRRAVSSSLLLGVHARQRAHSRGGAEGGWGKGEEHVEDSDDDYYSTSSELAESDTGIPDSLRSDSNKNSDGSTAPPLPCTPLDGCTVVTSHTAYHCRPRAPPEGLFLDLALSESAQERGCGGGLGASRAEGLGITLGLDMNRLYEVAAERKLAEGEIQRAMALYRNSQCSYIRQVTSLAKHGRVAEILSLVSVALSRTSELNGHDRRTLANMAIKCFVYQILDGDRREELMLNFKHFLMDNFDYNEEQALELFASCGLHDILVEVAKARGKLSVALDMVLKTGLPQLDGNLRKQLVSQGYITKFSAAGDMSFVRCMPPQQAISHLLAKPELIFRYTEFVRGCLGELDVKTLLKLAQLFDPSKPTLRPLLKSQRERSHSTGSSSSHDSYKTAQCSTDSEDVVLFPKPSVLIEIFIIILLTLNKKRRIHGSTLSLENGHECELIVPSCGSGESELGGGGGAGHRFPVGLIHPAQIVLACGQDHAAVVANGDVYTWGRAHEGRLGQGDIMSLDGRAPPLRVETLHMHGIRVRAVACGKEHTVVISHDGKLFSWGSSCYGQLGVGDRSIHSRPLAVEALTGQRCIGVACGQLHTLVLTHDQRMWSFGWGVHGQLGHGDVEDQLLPKLLPPFNKSAIVSVSAGYAHSAALTSDGQVWMIGSSSFGQLGTGSVAKSSVPVRLEALNSVHVSILTCGYYSNIAITSNPQKVYTWGKSPLELRQALQLARKRHQTRYAPDPHHQAVTRLPSLPHENQHLLPSLVPSNIQAPIKKVAMSGNHYLLLTTLGELYSWGSNEAGQLGVGNRVNQSVPVLVNKSRDDRFIAVAAGSRFSLAVNYQNQAVAWGSSEYGKLGMETREKMSLPSYPSSTAYPSNRGVSRSNPQTFLQPTFIPGIPTVQVERDSITSCESSDESSDGDDELQDSGVLESIISSLPDLAQPSEDLPIYSQPSIALTLTHLQAFCNSATILQHAISSEDWPLATELSQQTGDHISALGFSLRQLEAEPRGDHQSHQDRVVATVCRHLRCALEKAAACRLSDAAVMETGKQLLIQIFHYWHEQRQHLSMTALESLLLPHLAQLARPLSVLLFSTSDATEETQTPDKRSSDLLVAPSFLDGFSTAFCLQVSHCLVSEVSSSQPAGGAASLDRLLTDLAPVPTGSDRLQLGRAGEASSSYGSVPTDKLWQEILFNLRKDSLARGHIRLTGKDLADLAPGVGVAASTREGARPRKQPADDCVVFTCGHHYQKQELRRRVVTAWSGEMDALPTPLPVTQKALQAMYKEDGDRSLPGACPMCVHSAILAYQKE